MQKPGNEARLICVLVLPVLLVFTKVLLLATSQLVSFIRLRGCYTLCDANAMISYTLSFVLWYHISSTPLCLLSITGKWY